LDKKLGGLDLPAIEGLVLGFGAPGQLLGGNIGAPQKHPAHDDIAHGFKKRKSMGKSRFDIGRHNGFCQARGGFTQLPGSVLQRCRQGGQVFGLLCQVDGFLHFFQEIAKRLAAVHDDLAPQQVHGLDAVGAFVNGGDFAVPKLLFNGILLDVPIAAVDLHGLHGDIEPALGAVGLDQRREEFEQALVVFALLFGAGQSHVGDQGLGVIDETAQAIHVRFHPHEHAPYIRMPDNGYGRRVLAGGQVLALHALPGVVEGVQVRNRCMHKGLKAHAQAGFVHHVEHDFHALVLLAQQEAAAPAFAAQGHGGADAAVDAHFLFDAGADNIVAVAQGAVRVDPVLGDDEYGDPLGARGCALDPGKHRGDDVLGQVVLAVGDENLGAGQ
jgi:hypothetical protein